MLWKEGMVRVSLEERKEGMTISWMYGLDKVKHGIIKGEKSIFFCMGERNGDILSVWKRFIVFEKKRRGLLFASREERKA